MIPFGGIILASTQISEVVPPHLVLATAVGLAGLAMFFLVYGFVPEEVEEDEIFGYRLTKRRRLMVENDLYRGVMPLVQIFSHYFKKMPDIALGGLVNRPAIRDKLMRSGFVGSLTPNEYYGMCCVSALGMFLAGVFVTFGITGFPQLPVCLIFGAVGLFFPVFQVNGAIEDRLVEINRRLPYVIDLLVLSMRAGLDFMTALDRVVAQGQAQNADDPMIQELGVVLQEMKVGTARTDALVNLCNRVESEYLASMVGSILQSEKRGTPLAQVLEIQIETIRNKRTARVEKAASQAAVKILLPLMFIFGAVVVIVMGAFVLKIKNQ
jgi:tight adherence protein C